MVCVCRKQGARLHSLCSLVSREHNNAVDVVLQRSPLMFPLFVDVVAVVVYAHVAGRLC